MTKTEIYKNLLFLCSIIMLLSYYFCTQTQISYQNGSPYDAEFYVIMAEQIADSMVISADKPFVYRIATPFLVGKLFPQNILFGFKVINLFFALSTLVVLYQYLAYYLTNNTVIKFLILAYITNPNAPFRQVLFFPAQTDPAAIFFMLSILYIGRKNDLDDKQALLILILLGFVGTQFREIVVFPLLVQFVSILYLRFPHYSIYKVMMLSLPLLAGIISLMFTHVVVQGGGVYTFSGHLIESFTRLLDNFTMYPLAWFTAFGPLFGVVLILFNKATMRFLLVNPALILFTVGIAFGSMVSGWHVDRFMFWAFPTVLVLIGYILEKRLPVMFYAQSMIFICSLIVAQVIAHRVFFAIPDDSFGALFNPGNAPFLFLAAYGDTINFGQTFAAYMNTEARHILLVQYFVLTLYLWLISRVQVFLSLIRTKN